MLNKLPNLLTVKEVASWLGVHPMTVYRKAGRGELPAIKLGKQWLFPEDALRVWIDSQMQGGGGASVADTLRGVADLFKTVPEVRLVYLFGSHATGVTTPMSDIDIAYLDDGSSSQFDLDAKVEGIVLKAVPDASRIDLVRLNTAPIAVQYKVIRDGTLISKASDDELAAFEENVINRYLDYSVVLDRFYSDASKGFKEVS